jgi:hypothetical protein
MARPSRLSPGRSDHQPILLNAPPPRISVRTISEDFSVFSKISKKNESTSQVAESGNCDVAVGLGGLLEPQIY